MVGVARQPYCRVAATLGTRFHVAVLPLDPIFKCHMLSALRADALQRAKMRVQSGDSRLRPAYDRLVREADGVLLVGPFSVMDKPRTS